MRELERPLHNEDGVTTGSGPIGDTRESIYKVTIEDRLAGAGLRETQDVAGMLERYA